MVLNFIERVLDGYFACIPRIKPSMDAIRSARLIAHRGAHNNNQCIMENTLAAFELAHHLGCWGIELDVRETADKILVVNHDASLKRLWGHNQKISNLSFNELRRLVPDIPTLQEVVYAFGNKMHLFIELKTPFQAEDALVESLSGLCPGKNYHLLTLNSAIFYSLSQFPKNVLLLVSGIHNVKEFYNISLNENYGGLLGHYLLLTNNTIEKLKAATKIVGVGLVDSKYSLYRELNRGVNWLFTDRAAEINSYLC